MSYRPQQWQGQAQVSVTVPTGFIYQQQGSSAAVNAGNSIPAASNPNVPGGYVISLNTGEHQQQQTTTYVFDAVIRSEHQQRVTKTQHPIQTGANISDHAYMEPARVTLEIGMSDAMQSFYPNQWAREDGSQTKSVNAYQTLLRWAKARQPLIVTTRLNTYVNMLLVSVEAPDTAQTHFGLKATAVFEELLTGVVTSQPAMTARPDALVTTNLGAKKVVPVPASIAARYKVTTPPANAPKVPNAGTYSSNPVNSSTFDYSNYQVSE